MKYMQGKAQIQASMKWMNEWCFAQYKERELRDIGSNANNKICYEVRAPSSTSPPTPPCRISNPLSPTEGTSTEEDLLQQWSTELLSQTTTSQPRGRPVAKQQPTPLPKRFTNQSPPLTRGSTPQASTSTKEGANTNPIQQPQPLPKREQLKKSRVYNKWYISTTNHFPFSTKQDPNRLG